MDRQLVQPSALPLDTDILNTNRYAMVALGMAMKAILGTSTYVDGLACTANSPAALNVLVGAGSIYSYASVDATPFGSLAADTTDQIVQQGLVFGSTVLSCPAPGTGGQSINYLIEAQFQQTDASPVALLYYNASNPTQPLTGSATNTVRKGVCALQVKAGTAAATGSQVTPSPDAGWTGLYVVTVANGQATITAGSISTYPGAPFLANKLAALNFGLGLQTDGAGNITLKLADNSLRLSASGLEVSFAYLTAGGSGNALTVSPSPAITAVDGRRLWIKPTATNSGATTLDATGSAIALVRADGVALQAGDIVNGAPFQVAYDTALAKWRMVSATPSQLAGTGLKADGAGHLAPDIDGLSAKVLPVSTDEVMIADSAASFGLKKVTIDNIAAAFAVSQFVDSELLFKGML